MATTFDEKIRNCLHEVFKDFVIITQEDEPQKPHEEATPPDTKRCKDCNRVQPLNAFRPQARICTKCSNFLSRQRVIGGEKECRICKEMVLGDNFTMFRLACNFCAMDDRSEKVTEGNHGLKFNGRGGIGSRDYLKSLYISDTEKECKECNVVKPNAEYRSNRRICKDCERGHGRQYRRDTDTAKTWNENNKDRMSELSSNWRENNRDKIRETQKTRYHTDDQYRIKNNMRSIHTQMMKKGINYNGKPASFYKGWYIHNAMKMGLNLGTVAPRDLCVDHLVPLDTFDLTNDDEFKLAFDWRNTQRILQKDNREKSNILPTIDELKAQQKISVDYLASTTNDENEKKRTYVYFDKLCAKLK